MRCCAKIPNEVNLSSSGIDTSLQVGKVALQRETEAKLANQNGMNDQLRTSEFTSYLLGKYAGGIASDSD